MGWSLSQIRRKRLNQVLSNPEAMTIFYWSVWPNLEPSLSPFSYFVTKREALVGPFHQTTQNQGGKKIGWQRGFLQQFVSGGDGEVKMGIYLNALHLQNDRAKGNHTGAHALLNHSDKVSPQWFLFLCLAPAGFVTLFATKILQQCIR